MKVVSSQRTVPSKGSAKTSAANPTGATFSPDMGALSAGTSAGIASVSSLTSIDSLLAVQAAQGPDDALTGRGRAVANATETLDILDDIKLGLLAGELPLNKLQRLLERVETERDDMEDPELENLLDHIELRARVELAKYGN
ncbi:flagellar assembly protein FliX [Parvibaculum lavamentivorans]|nr:flagellar assembly protein FliX [Parvibaculum lavamentivorans]